MCNLDSLGVCQSSAAKQILSRLQLFHNNGVRAMCSVVSILHHAGMYESTESLSQRRELTANGHWAGQRGGAAPLAGRFVPELRPLTYGALIPTVAHLSPSSICRVCPPPSLLTPPPPAASRGRDAQITQLV